MLLLLLTLAADPADDAVKALGRGVNLGNALDAPKEGEWGLRIQCYRLFKQSLCCSVRSIGEVHKSSDKKRTR